MKILKKILIVVAVLIALPLIIALFVDKEYLIKRDIVVNKPKQEVFDYIKVVRNQEKYSKWVMLDPNMKKEFTGTDGTVGFIYAWDSEEAGKGEEEITSITEGEKIEIELRFIKPFEGTGLTEMTTETVADGQTRVAWQMKGASKYPMNFTNLFVHKILGKDMDESLRRLKANLEN